jgi:hypothetical protein
VDMQLHAQKKTWKQGKLKVAANKKQKKKTIWKCQQLELPSHRRLYLGSNGEI